MNNINLSLHLLHQLPLGLELPLPFSIAQSSEPKLSDLAYLDGAIHVFDGEDWQKFDFAKTLKELTPSPKGFSAEPMARALDLIKQPSTRVIDASCGSGKDALQVWQWGREVVAYERHPQVFMLLWDALRRHPLPNFTLKFGDASLETFSSTDHIMFDPMFEEVSKKKSRPRKHMFLFKQMVGPDTDQHEVFERLLKSGAGRIVVKRPVRHEVAAKPNHSLLGKTMRLDVYLGKTS